MSNEIQYYDSALSGSNLYAIIRAQDGTVRNVVGGSWDATPTAGEIDNYDIALTEQSTLGLFYANEPSGVTSATVSYSITIHERIGASPAASDPVLMQGVLGPVIESRGTLSPTVAGRTLDVTATGEAGIDWGNIGNPTSGVSLTATQISGATSVTTVANLNSNSVNAAALATDAVDEITNAIAAAAAISPFRVDIRKWNGSTPNDLFNGYVPADVNALGSDEQSLADLKDFADSGYDPSSHKIIGINPDGIDANAVQDGALSAGKFFAVDGKTLQEAIRIVAAIVAGKISGAGSGTETFKGVDGTTTRAVVTVDSSGNRSNVSYP